MTGPTVLLARKEEETRQNHDLNRNTSFGVAAALSVYLVTAWTVADKETTGKSIHTIYETIGSDPDKGWAMGAMYLLTRSIAVGLPLSILAASFYEVLVLREPITREYPKGIETVASISMTISLAVVAIATFSIFALTDPSSATWFLATAVVMVVIAAIVIVFREGQSKPTK